MLLHLCNTPKSMHYWLISTKYNVVASKILYMWLNLGKLVLSTRNTLVCFMAPISCSVAMCYPKSVSFIEFFMDCCTYNDILDTIWITDKKLLHFKLSNPGQILHIDKTGFPRPGHILRCYYIRILVSRFRSWGERWWVENASNNVI